MKPKYGEQRDRLVQTVKYSQCAYVVVYKVENLLL
jgi:hypothetical protein